MYLLYIAVCKVYDTPPIPIPECAIKRDNVPPSDSIHLNFASSPGNNRPIIMPFRPPYGQDCRHQRPVIQYTSN